MGILANLFGSKQIPQAQPTAQPEIEARSVTGANFQPSFWVSGATGAKVSMDDVTTRPYMFHSWTYACARAIMTNVGRLQQNMQDVKDPEVIAENHPILELLECPNPLMDRVLFRQTILASLLLPCGAATKNRPGGLCYVIAWDSKKDAPADLTKGIPSELMPFSEMYIEPIYGAQGKGRQSVTGYKFEIPGVPESRIQLPVTSVIRITLHNPYDIMKGMSPYMACNLNVMTDAQADVFNQRLFANDARPSGVLSSDQTLPPMKKREIMEGWYEQYGGLGNVGKTAVLDAGTKYQHIGFTNADMQWKEQKQGNKDAVISAYGLNKIAIGDYEQINFATIKEGRRLLWYDTYMPMDDLILSAFNRYFVKFQDGGKYRLVTDYTVVESLQSDNMQKAQTAAILRTQMGYPATLAARTVGLPLSRADIEKWPELDEVPSQGFAFPSFGGGESDKPTDDDDAEKDEPVPTGSDEQKGVKVRALVTEDDRTRYGDEYVLRVLDPAERDFLKGITRYFVSQRNAILDNVDAWAKDTAKVNEAITRETPSVEASRLLLSLATENQKMLRMYRPYVEEAVRLETANLERELGALIEWSVKDQLIDSYVQMRSGDLMNINTHTISIARDAITGLSSQAFDQGWTPADLAREIKNSVQQIYNVRLGQPVKPNGFFDLGGMSSSRTIARTEMGSITSRARFDAFRAEGIDKHQWVTFRDDRTRDTHRALDGKPAEVGQAFPNSNLRFPRDPQGDAGEVINCRCTTVPMFDD